MSLEENSARTSEIYMKYLLCIIPANEEQGGRHIPGCQQESTIFPQRCETLLKLSTTVAGSSFQADTREDFD